jgi:hypothetical protein
MFAVSRAGIVGMKENTQQSWQKPRAYLGQDTPHRRRDSGAPNLMFEFYWADQSARQSQTPRIRIDRIFFKNGCLK